MSRMISARLSRLEREAAPDTERFVISAALPSEGLQPEPPESAISPVLTEAEWLQAYCERTGPALIS